MHYSWPGNVRELKSALEYAFVTCNGSVIEPNHLPPDIFLNDRPFPVEENVRIDRDDIQKRQLIEALERAGGNQSKAARILNVSRVTVWNRMKKFGIKPIRKLDL